MSEKFKILFILFLLCLIANTAHGTLDITSPVSATLTGKTVSIAVQTSTGAIAGVEVSDTGTAGWTATMTSTHFTTRATHKTLVDVDSDGIDGFTGTYDGLDGVLDPNGTFIVEITTGGAVEIAVFKWTDPAGNETTDITTADTNSLSNGITVDWTDAATYDVGDKFSCGVDVFPYAGLYITPSDITIVSGDTGVSKETAEYLIGAGATSDAKTIMAGVAENSAGAYQQDEGLELSVHANSLSGNFSAIATLTVS